MAVTLTNSQLSAGLYSAFWNRAPDATGQNFWVGQLNAGTPVLDIATAFYNAPEGLAAYPNWIRNNPTALVTQAYESIFERAPDPQGLAFYVNQLNHGASFPQVIINMVTNAVNSAAAGNTDGMQFLNEIQVGVYVSEVLRTDDPAITSVALQGVTYEQSSVVAREAELYDMVYHGETFTLTTSPDNVQGTEFNDVINAPLGSAGAVPLQTLQNFDTINGGGGVDTLNATLPAFNDVISPVSLANVEIVNLTAVGQGAGVVGLNLITDAAVQNVNNVGSIADLLVTGIVEGAELSVVNNIAGTATDFRFVQGAASDVNLTVSDVMDGEIDVTNTSGTVNLTSTTAGILNGNSVVLGTGVGDVVDTVNVDGSADLDLTAADATLVDASAFTGDLTFELEQVGGVVLGGSGNDTLSANVDDAAISGNEGDDTITVTGDAAEVHGNEGADAIVISGEDAVVTGNEGDDTITVTGGAAVVNGNEGNDTITVTVTANDATISGDEGDDLIQVNGSAGTVEISGGAGDDTVTVNTALSATTTVDGGEGANLLNFNVSTDAALVSADAVVTNIQTVQVNMADNAGDAALVQSLNASLIGGLETINVYGQDDNAANILNVTDLTGTEQININQAVTGFVLNVGSTTATTANVNIDLPGGAGGEILIAQGEDSTIATLDLTVSAQSYADVEVDAAVGSPVFSTINIAGGAAGETLVIGTDVPLTSAVIDATDLASDLTLTLAGDIQSVTGGTGDDTFNFGTSMSSFDVVDGGEGNNVINYTNLTGINAATVTNVQTFNVTVNDDNTVAASAFSGKNSSGIETINVIASDKNASQDLSFTDLDSSLSMVTVDGTIGDLTIGATAADVTLAVGTGGDVVSSIGSVTINNGGDLTVYGTATKIGELFPRLDILGAIDTNASALTLGNGVGSNLQSLGVTANSATTVELTADGNLSAVIPAGIQITNGISATAATDFTVTAHDASVNTGTMVTLGAALQNLTLSATTVTSIVPQDLTFTGEITAGEDAVSINTVSVDALGAVPADKFVPGVVSADVGFDVSSDKNVSIDTVSINTAEDGIAGLQVSLESFGVAGQASVGSIDIVNHSTDAIAPAAVVLDLTLTSTDSSIDALNVDTADGATTDINLTGTVDTVIDLNGGALAGAGDLNITTTSLTAIDLSNVNTDDLSGTLTITGDSALVAAVGTAYGENIDLSAAALAALVEGGGGSDNITLGANALVDTVFYAEQSDSTGLVYDYVTNFGGGAVALIDLSTLQYPLTGGDYKGTTVNATVTYTSATDVTFEVTNAVGFFEGARNAVSAAAGTDATVVFIDANGSGNWEAADDMAIVLVGNISLTSDNFNFGS